MNDNYITGLHYPTDSKNAATKQYVDLRCVKNSVGYVPNLISNNRNKSGFIVSASSEVRPAEACNVFNATRGEWLSGVNRDFWIQIRCPEAVWIYRFAVRGVKIGTIKNWKLQASNDDNTWDDIYDNLEDGNGRYIDHNLQMPDIESLIRYSNYRIIVSNADGANPGLNYWQLFTVDTLA